MEYSEYTLKTKFSEFLRKNNSPFKRKIKKK